MARHSFNLTVTNSLFSKLQPRYSTIISVLNFLFAVLFLYTGVNKLLVIENFQVAMGITILKPFAVILSYTVPIVEIIIAILLVTPSFTYRHRVCNLRKAGFYAFTSMMLLFTLYVIYTLIFRANDLPCSCGGALNTLTWMQHLYFNLLFLLLATWQIILLRKIKKQSR
jgi:hypothetical protein